jgi:phage terminase Nu1 subunit (DNA packaging protein)
VAQIKGKKFLAVHFGVNPETIAEWREEGAPLDGGFRGNDRTLEEWLSIHHPAIIANKANREARRPVLSSTGASPLPMTEADFEDVFEEANWSVALKREQTIKLRRENAYREGRLLDRNAVEIAMNRIATTIRDRLVALPRSVAPECENKKATIIEQIISREVREALVGLADIVGRLDVIAKDQG